MSEKQALNKISEEIIAMTAVIAMISSEILFNACFSDIVSPH